MKIIIFFIFFISLNAHSASWKKVITTSAAGGGTGGTVITSAQCPTGYILVPKNTTYIQSDFCVMKYEAKNDGFSNAASVAAGLPWVSITRTVMRTKCQTLGHGYDLISNDQWQTIGRNILSVAANWSSGVVASGQVNQGHVDNAPVSALAASTDDNDGCVGTGQTCSSSVWNSQRRTSVLSNGNIIWDFSGNVQEAVTLDVTVAAYWATMYVSNSTSWPAGQLKYGPATGTICATPSTTPYCGFGYGYFDEVQGGIARGSYWANTVMGGLFMYVSINPAVALATTGFRCVYKP